MTEPPRPHELVDLLMTGSRVPLDRIKASPGGGYFPADPPVIVAEKRDTSAHDGSLVSGYRAAFLVAIGISVMAVLIVGLQMRARTILDKLGKPNLSYAG